MFQFQQFTIHDDRCAMKVGTDGVLLGAWCQMPPTSFADTTKDTTIRKALTQQPPQHTEQTLEYTQEQAQGQQVGVAQKDNAGTPSAARALDIGTGSGLIAMMLAQRYPQGQIVGVELDADATTQAIENVVASPFASQIVVKQGDIMSEDWREDLQPFDMIVSNPPYFEETLLSPNQQRAQARHVHHGLTFEALTQRSAQLLKSGGWLQVIIPKTAQSRFVRCAQDAGFSLIHQTDVHTVARKAPKRVMLRFQLHFTPPTHHENGHTIIGDFLQTDQLILQENGERSPQYQQLCADFYLTQGQLDARASKDEKS